MGKWSMSQTVITVNGKSYHSVDEMPPDVRRKYEDAISKLADRDGNGVPDILEGKGDANTIGTVTTHRYVIDGKDAKNLEGLPPEIRARIAQKMELSETDERPGGITIHVSTRTLLFLGAAAIFVAVVIVMSRMR